MLGLHLLNYSTELLNFARGAAIVKMVDPDPDAARFIKTNSPDAIIILRIHSLSEQHDYSDPAVLAIRHADELCARAKAVGATHVEGWNESDVSSQENRWHLGAYYGAFARRCHELQICAVVGNISVGKPEIADWPDFHEMINAMRIEKNPLKSDFLGLHEYWQFNGPADGWSWYAGRFTRCPFQIPIIITECGIDQGINLYPEKQNPKHGWRSCVSADVYAGHLAEYIRLCSSDPRFVGATPFTFGGGFGWDDFDVTPILELLRPLMCHELKPITTAGQMIRVLVDGEVKMLPLEEYLRGVVPMEMGAVYLKLPDDPEHAKSTDPHHTEHTEYEALKAQAVLARTYALHSLKNPRGKDFDIYGDTRGQAYNVGRIHLRSDQAIIETEGIYLVDQNGEPFFAQYTQRCGMDFCPWCKGNPGNTTAKNDGHWPGRACQFGMQDLAQNGMGWREISKYYYGDAVKLSDE